MSTYGDSSEYTLCPSNRSIPAHHLIRGTTSQSSERSGVPKFVQYINPATYIERNVGSSEKDFSDGDATLDDVENINSSYEITSGMECASKTHVCKIEVNNEMAQERQRRYEEWLRNKRKIARDRKLQLKVSEEREGREHELKRQMSREKVLEWMSKKTNSSCGSKKSVVTIDEGSSTVQTLQVKTKPDKELNFEAWLKKKEKQNQENIERQKQNSFYQEQYDHYRKCLSTAFYNKWTQLSREKPRPVPLNQGFASLAGSTTTLYVNPQPWSHI